VGREPPVRFVLKELQPFDANGEISELLTNDRVLDDWTAVAVRFLAVLGQEAKHMAEAAFPNAGRRATTVEVFAAHLEPDLLPGAVHVADHVLVRNTDVVEV